MPISPENRARYGKEWKKIRDSILTRAKNRCERCGAPNHEMIVRSKANPADYLLLSEILLDTGGDPDWSAYREPVRVVLTIAHLNHTPEDSRPENLAALCQRDHLLLDTRRHVRVRRANREKRSGQRKLPNEG